MYITINDVIGKKTIDLSYPIYNFNQEKEIAVISMFSDNIQYEMKESFKLKLIDGSEKQVLKKDLYNQRIRHTCRTKTHSYHFRQ